ncbi:MAG TPA: trypsin-like peptidase domain-containing protein, partial [Gemmataceae bacterium]|nr:trypsin-like peptidase domain-containing protein [Gemmataceae bacterium]
MARWPFALAFLIVGGLAGALITTTGLQGQVPPPPPVFPRELSSYRDVVKRVLPAVVSIESKPVARKVSDKKKQDQPRRRMFFDIPGLPDDARKQLEEQFQLDDGDLEQQFPQHSFGSGFVIDPKGVILTNYHVVAGADRVEIRFKDDDNKTFVSTDIKGDPKNDLAIVRIKTNESLPYVQLGDSDAMEIGDRVLAFGAPFGLTGTVTSGIVSAKGRGHMTGGTAVVYEDYLQTDAAINPGNSGGPLVNLEGQVVGINTMIKTRSGASQGVGLAISSNVAKSVAEQLIKNGAVHRGYLGVYMRDLRAEEAAALGLKNSEGIWFSQVVPGGPAAKAGLHAGDVITSVEGKPVKDGRDLQRLVGNLSVGKKVELTVLRDSNPQTFAVTLGDQPKDLQVATRPVRSTRSQGDEEEKVNVDKLGMSLTDLTPELAKTFGFSDDAKGAMIAAVEPGVARDAGLQRGFLITRVNRKPVTSAAKAADLLQKADLEKGVLVQV